MSLTTGEQSRLADLEKEITECLESFYKMGRSLTEIRDAKLYRAEHDTFEDYCQSRWKMSRQRAYQLMGAAQTVETLSTAVDTPLPETEGQIRSLTNLNPEQQQRAWSAATQIADRPKNIQVEKAVAAVRKPQQFQLGQEVTVQDQDSPYAGQLVEVIASDGVIVQAKTSWGEIVPLLSSEIQPEQPKSAPTAKAPQPDYAAVVQAKYQAEQARSLALEVELKKLIGMIQRRSSYADLEVAAVCAERLVQIKLAV